MLGVEPFDGPGEAVFVVEGLVQAGCGASDNLPGGGALDGAHAALAGFDEAFGLVEAQTGGTGPGLELSHDVHVGLGEVVGRGVALEELACGRAARCFIGWSAEQRVQRLHLIVNNARFRNPLLASH